MLICAKREGSLRGIQVIEGFILTYLQFVNDIIFLVNDQLGNGDT